MKTRYLILSICFGFLLACGKGGTGTAPAPQVKDPSIYASTCIYGIEDVLPMAGSYQDQKALIFKTTKVLDKISKDRSCEADLKSFASVMDDVFTLSEVKGTRRILIHHFLTVTSAAEVTSAYKPNCLVEHSRF